MRVSGLLGASHGGVTLVMRTHKPPGTKVRSTYLYVSPQQLARTDIDAFVRELAERIERVTQAG